MYFKSSIKAFRVFKRQNVAEMRSLIYTATNDGGVRGLKNKFVPNAMSQRGMEISFLGCVKLDVFKILIFFNYNTFVIRVRGWYSDESERVFRGPYYKPGRCSEKVRE